MRLAILQLSLSISAIRTLNDLLLSVMFVILISQVLSIRYIVYHNGY